MTRFFFEIKKTGVEKSFFLVIWFKGKRKEIDLLF